MLKETVVPQVRIELTSTDYKSAVIAIILQGPKTSYAHHCILLNTENLGTGDESRTHNLNLGKVAL